MISADGLRTILPQGKGNRIRQGEGFPLRPQARELGGSQCGLRLRDVLLVDGAVVVWLAAADPGALGIGCAEQAG